MATKIFLPCFELTIFIYFLTAEKAHKNIVSLLDLVINQAKQQKHINLRLKNSESKYKITSNTHRLRRKSINLRCSDLKWSVQLSFECTWDF